TPDYSWYPKGSTTASPPAPLPKESPSDPGSCDVNGQISPSTRGACTGTFTPNATTQTQATTTGNSLYDSLSSCPSSFDGCVEVIVYWIFYTIPSFLLGVVARFFDVIVALTLSSGIYARATFLGTAWTVVRD